MDNKRNTRKNLTGQHWVWIKIKRKINVFHLVKELTIGGLEKVLTAIALILNKKEYNVSVWSLKEDGFFADKLVKEGFYVLKYLIFSPLETI